MLHTDIKLHLDNLISDASNGQYDTLPWVGFGRVLETLIQIGEASDDPLIQATLPQLRAGLLAGESAGPLKAIDYHASDSQLGGGYLYGGKLYD